MRDDFKKKQNSFDQIDDSDDIYDDNAPDTEKGKLTVKKKKKMKPGCLVGLIIVLVLVIGLIVAGIGFYPLIHAFFHGLTKAPDDIAAEISKSKEDTARALNDSGISVSLDDLERAESGEMSEEEITEMIYEAMFAEQSGAASEPTDETASQTVASGEDEKAETEPAKTDAPANGTEQTALNDADTSDKTTVKADDKTPDRKTEEAAAQKDAAKTDASDKKTGTAKTAANDKKTGGKTKMTSEQVDHRVAELVAQVYVLKSQYTGLLGSFEASVKAQYSALPREQHNAAGKAKIVSDNMGYVAGLEAQCDAQMAAITGELTTLLKDNGRDTSIVDAINSAYVGEKELKKAYYVSLYK